MPRKTDRRAIQNRRGKITTKQALKYFDGSANLGRALGISRQAPYRWGKYPPIERQAVILKIMADGHA